MPDRRMNDTAMATKPTITPALSELLRGKGAHVDPIACVEDIAAELASKRVADFPHSIAQLVSHMNYWMDYELRRIRGERPKYPEHGEDSFPPATWICGTSAWDEMKKHLADLLSEFSALADSPPEEIQRQIESGHEVDKLREGTLEAVLWQIVAHNSYHTGQITMLRRALGAWPPRAGSDTW